MQLLMMSEIYIMVSQKCNVRNHGIARNQIMHLSNLYKEDRGIQLC